MHPSIHVESPATPALLLNHQQAAAALSISEGELWTISRAVDIPSIKFGSEVRYPVDGLRAWIARVQSDIQLENALDIYGIS